MNAATTTTPKEKTATKSNTTAEKRKARVFLVDDHPIVRRGMADLIGVEPDLEVCGEATSAGETIEQLGEARPTIVIIDLTLKDGSGIELIKQLKFRDPSLKMLVSSMHDETLYAERVLRAGAMGYINKEEVTDKIVKAIRHVLGGKIWLSDQMASRVLHRVMLGEPELDKSPMDQLSDRELEVFELLGQGLTTRQIAKKLHLSPKTIDTHREHIKTKLKLENSSQLVRHAVEWVAEQRQ